MDIESLISYFAQLLGILVPMACMFRFFYLRLDSKIDKLGERLDHKIDKLDEKLSKRIDMLSEKFRW